MTKKNFVKGDFVFENELSVGLLTMQDSRNISDVDITYDGDFIDEITIGSRVITFTNNGDNYTKWEDADYEWTPTYTDDKLTKIEVLKK
jgi:hypothetical protein